MRHRNMLKTRENRIISVFLTVSMMILLISHFPQSNVYAAQNRTANFNKSYSLGSNLSQNMVNVAYAQIGKTGADLNYTENWCADFVSDCAELAGFGSAVPRNANCTNLYNAIKKLEELI